MTTASAPSHAWIAGGRKMQLPVDFAPGQVIAISTEKPITALPWLATVVERLNDVVRLEPGWDGETASSPTREAALASLRALFEVMWQDSPAPAIIPMYDGGLQLEWHGQGLDVELSVAPAGDRHVWIAEASGREIDDEFRSVVEDLRKHLGALGRV
jgi:hypothetical protein